MNAALEWTSDNPVMGKQEGWCKGKDKLPRGGEGTATVTWEAQSGGGREGGQGEA